MKSIIGLKLYQLTGNQIGDIKKSYRGNPKHIDRYLPMYCLNDRSRIKETDYYLQYTEEGDKVYTLFDVTYTDDIVGEEISCCGLSDLFKGIDIDFSGFIYYNYVDRNLIPDQYLVVELTYNKISCGFGEAVEYDMEFKVIGKLSL